MMEDMQTIFSVGASAVTKLVHHTEDGETIIERIFNPKYPYEYIQKEKDDPSRFDKIEEKVMDFYSKIR